MLLAMGIASFLCIAIGVYPAPLYALLPFEVSYDSYTTTHVITQLQLLFFSALAFTVLMRTGIYPPELKSVNLDSDWTYRRMLPMLFAQLSRPLGALWHGLGDLQRRWVSGVITRLYHTYGPQGRTSQFWPTGAMVMWIAVLLGVTLVVNYVS